MITTAIYFDYGGCYIEGDNGCEWDSKGASLNALPFKTSSIEDITYSVLEKKIRKKIGLDKSAKITISYIPLAFEAKRQSYIRDDDDVLSYLYTMSGGQLRSVLHVEINLSEGVSSFGMNYDEMESNAKNDNNAITLHEEEEEEEHNDGLLGIDGFEDDDGNDDGNDDGFSYGNDDGNDDDIPLASDDGVDRINQSLEEWDDGMTLEVGQEIERKEQIQNVLMIASHKRFYDFKVVESDTWRYTVKCRERGCKWYLRVSRPQGSKGSWKVKTYRNKHTCSRVSASTTNPKRKGSSSLVASIVQDKYPGVLETPPPKSIMAAVTNVAGVHVSYTTAWRGRKRAAFVVRGNPEESYLMLPSYLYMLERTNIGTVTRLEVDEGNRFKYLFIALGACIEGFQAMRKVLSVDATFLTTSYGGVLVFATAQDPNHHHYPIAIAVLDGENMASWNWFFTTLKTIVPDDPELVFLTDRNASLIKGISDVYPRANHGFCAFHLSQNVRSKASNTQKKSIAEEFRALSEIYTVPEFEKKYEHFRNNYKKVAVYLDQSVAVERWAKCVFPGCRYNIGTTNSSESLNNVFKDARKYSLLLMLDTIIEKIAEWFNKHRTEAAEGQALRKLVPFVENELHKICEEAAKLTVREINFFMMEYCVIGVDGLTYLVDLRNKTCACKRFDFDKYPCIHGVAALFAYMRNGSRQSDIHLWDLCTRYYLTDTWILAYYRTVYPVPCNSQWHGIPENVKAMISLPPPRPERKGRLQETRYPSVGESRRKRTSNRPVPGLDLGAAFESLV